MDRPATESDGTSGIPLAPIGEEGPLSDLLDAIWNRDPAPVALVGGHWRWRSVAAIREEVRALLAQRLGPESLPFYPSRAHRVALPPTDPASRPCEVMLYPVLLHPPANVGVERSDTRTLYLCLFYSTRPSGREPSVADRERAYFRVVEALDHLQAEAGRRHPGSSVRAVDLPMPGWMGAQLSEPLGNACPLVMG